MIAPRLTIRDEGFIERLIDAIWTDLWTRFCGSFSFRARQFRWSTLAYTFIQRYFSNLLHYRRCVSPFLSPLLFHYIEFITSRTIYSREILKKKKERIIQMKVTSLSLSFSLLNKTRIKWKWKSMIWRRRKNKKRQKGEQWRERDELSSQLNSIQRSLPPRWSHPSSYNLIGMRMPLLGGITPLSALESLLKTQ